MSNASQWSSIAANNNSAAPNGWPEGQSPSSVNDCAREMMAALAKWYTDQKGTITTGGTTSAYTLTTTNAHAALTDIALFAFQVNAANTGAATLAVDGLTAKSMRINGNALAASDLRTNEIVLAVYNPDTDVFDIFKSSSFTDADHTKLDGIESGATADQTNAEIRTAVEAATDSNVFTDADHSKLDGIEAGADVTDTTNVAAAGALMDSEVDADIKSLALPANTTISTFGASLVDDASASEAANTLGLGTADEVTHNNLTLSGGAYIGGTVAANYLDDYEESGTFTPVLSDGTNNATSSVAVGRYTKIGNRVFFDIHLTTSSLGSVSGTVRISGLPFTSANVANYRAGIAVSYAASLSIVAGQSLGGYINNNSTFMFLHLWDIAGGVTSLDATEWTANGSTILSGMYEAA